MPGKHTAWRPLNSVGIELEQAGEYWDAVRVECPLAERVLARLTDLTGSVIQHHLDGVMYWLIEPGSADDWDEMPQVRVLGSAKRTYVTVPSARLVDPVSVFWRVPYNPDRYLTDAGVLHTALKAVLKAAVS